jgi:tyrosyl-tRNA synthetase
MLMTMNKKTQSALNRLIANSAEIITEDELKKRLTSSGQLNHYIGFEISGYVHLGTGLMTALVIKDLLEVGVKCTIWLADWHTWINEKLDGTKETAAKIGEGYFQEAMKASLIAVGADYKKVDFKLASKHYDEEYWNYVVAVAKNTTLSRMQRSINILGRQEGDSVDFAKLMYPAMQVADIFSLKVDIAHAGMDQRKAHVIMRDVAEKIQPDNLKPIALHHPLLTGLQKPTTWPIPEGADPKDIIMEMKMSKSDPRSAIWVHDTPDQIDQKVKQAFCPEREIHYNPILNWIGHLLWWDEEKTLRIERKKEHGGDIEFLTYKDLETAYAEGDVHPMDLKVAVGKELTELLKPARDHFEQPKVAAKKEELDKLLKL